MSQLGTVGFFMKKVMLVVFNGDEMCFIHVLLSVLDMSEKSFDVGIIIGGASTKLISKLEKEAHFLHAIWEKVKTKGLVTGACRVRANKMGTLKAAEWIGLPIIGDMSGHSSLAAFMDDGFNIITF